MPMLRRNVSTTCVALALAHQPGVDVDARQLVADRPVHERRGDRRVDAAATARRSPGRRRPGRGSRATCSSMIEPIVHVGAHPASSCRKRSQHRHAVRRVDDLGVELHAPDPARASLSSAATGRVGRATPWPRSRRGASVTASKWLIHTSCVARAASCEQRRRPSVTCELWPGRTRRACRGRRRRRAAGRSAGRRSRCRGSGCRGRRSPGRASGAPSTCTLFGPPDRISAAGAIARPPRRR